MIYKIFLITFLLGGCSFQTPKNQWQYKSTNAFSSFSKNYLTSNDVLAKSDLKRATLHAKKSANLDQLASIYIGESALHICVGKKDNCSKYKNIKELINNTTIEAYYHLLIQTIKEEEIILLPKHYQSFAQHFLTKEYKKAQEDIVQMQKITSQLISAALIKEHLSNETRNYLIKSASFYGYKKAVLFWLDELSKHTKDPKKLQLIKKKILILQEGML